MSFDDIPFENNGKNVKHFENKYNVSKSFMMENWGYYVIPLTHTPIPQYKLTIHNSYQCRFTVIYYALLFTLASRAFMQIIWRVVQTQILFDRYDRPRNVPAMCPPNLSVQTTLSIRSSTSKENPFTISPVLIHHQYRLEITGTTVVVAGGFVQWRS